jgi:pilus assembly protein Flp/PilA
MTALIKQQQFEKGQGLVEYALILVLVAVVAIVILALMGQTVASTFNCLVMTMNAVQGSPIVGLTLIDSTTDEAITPICGQTISLAGLNGHMTIRVDTKGTVGSVSIQLTGPSNVSRTENIFPYSLFGDTDGDFSGGSLNSGDYTLTATAYSASDGGGSSLGSATITFSVS